MNAEIKPAKKWDCKRRGARIIATLLLTTVLLCSLVSCRNASDSSETDTEQGLSQPNSAMDQDTNDTSYYMPKLNGMEEEDKIATAKLAIEEIWQTDLTGFEALSQVNNDTIDPYQLISFKSEDNKYFYSVSYDKETDMIVGMDVLVKDDAAVSVSDKEKYLETATAFARDKLSVSNVEAGSAYLPRIPQNMNARVVIVTFPDAALYVEVESDFSVLGYRFMNDEIALNAYIEGLETF